MTYFNDVLQQAAKDHKFDQYFFFGTKGETWLMTCSPVFDKDKMKRLRDYLTKELETEGADHG